MKGWLHWLVRLEDALKDFSKLMQVLDLFNKNKKGLNVKLALEKGIGEL
jgi:hypothetical protein